MTPYDVAVVLVGDGATLHGTAPDDVTAYVDAHRRSRTIGSIARVRDGSYVTAASLRACVVAALRHLRGEREEHADESVEDVWLELVAQARLSGALIGAFPTEDER
jgi:hypothetical protein